MKCVINGLKQYNEMHHFWYQNILRNELVKY